MEARIEDIESAAQRVRPHIVRTPVVEVSGAHLKLEPLQFTGSFKVRGYFNAALGLAPQVLERGLLTVSAGNAAQACAYVARHLGVPCRVVMPDTAPPIKFEGVRRWGGVPTTMPRLEMLAWMEGGGWNSEPEAFIHPFADDAIITGHGSLGLELLEDLPGLERLLVPVGGGGLITGVARAVKLRRPQVEVIGVQSDGYNVWPKSFAAGGGPVTADLGTIADGSAGPWTQRMHDLMAEVVDDWLVVPEPRLRAAIPELAAKAKIVAEGAGALAYAALEQLEPGPVTAAVVSGGNIDPALLAELLA